MILLLKPYQNQYFRDAPQKNGKRKHGKRETKSPFPSFKKTENGNVENEIRWNPDAQSQFNSYY